MVFFLIVTSWNCWRHLNKPKIKQIRLQERYSQSSIQVYQPFQPCMRYCSLWGYVLFIVYNTCPKWETLSPLFDQLNGGRPCRDELIHDCWFRKRCVCVYLVSWSTFYHCSHSHCHGIICDLNIHIYTQCIQDRPAIMVYEVTLVS